MTDEWQLKAAGWHPADQLTDMPHSWTLDGIDWYTEDEALVVVLRAEIERLTKERDAAISDRDSMAQTLGEARVELAEARATNARLHRRAQGVEAGKPDDEETIRRLRREVRSMAKHAGYVAGHVYRLTDARNAAMRETYETRRDLATMTTLYERTCAERDAAYERGLRRGMAIAREHEFFDERTHDMACAWHEAEAQMEREIEEAKR